MCNLTHMGCLCLDHESSACPKACFKMDSVKIDFISMRQTRKHDEDYQIVLR